ncbi:MAG TPA: lysylphosphatidylglycerol synthase transmembrane domain-containing protein [Polyangiaceae bacterium]|jgi:hypothetical protein|nr:lysylphosphatidylglycerol synthase transmembrane domain-containing protein [Polyangiaceae bacterium]
MSTTPTEPESGETVLEEVREVRPARFGKKHVRALLGSVVIVGIFVWVMRRGSLPMLPPSKDLARTDGLLVFLFVCGMLSHLLLRFARSYYLTAPIAHVPMRRLMTINAISMVVITVLPLRLGEMARPAMLRTQGHLSGWAVTGTVFAERIIDGIVYTGALLLGLMLAVPHEPLPTSVGKLPVPASLVPQAGRIAALGFVGAFVVMLIFYRFRSFARNVTEKTIGVVSVSLGKRVADAVGRLSDGLSFLTNFRYTVPYVLVTFMSAFSHIWAIQMLGHAVGLTDLTLSQSTLIVGVLSLGFALPNAPGFFGAVQLALYAGLAVYVTPEQVIGPGAVLVFIFYITYLGLVFSLGGLALGLEYIAPSPAPRAREVAG